MNYSNVLTQLNKELSERRRSREKSKDSYSKGNISFELHRTHLNNLNPLINEYESAIEKLTEN